jgi:hypothetical protein
MKKIILLLLFTLITTTSYASNAIINSIYGNVQLKIHNEWVTAFIGQEIPTSTIISTGFGSEAKISIGGMELNVKPLTRVSINELNGNTTRISLQSGRVRATRSTSRNVDFRVSTPVATAAVRGTDFNISFNRVDVYEGLVQFSQGEAFVMIPGGTYSFAINGLRPIDPIDTISENWSVSINDSSNNSKNKALNCGTVRLELQ